MTVWVVTVNGRINSVWADEHLARAHVAQLIRVNGDQLGVRMRDYMVRD